MAANGAGKKKDFCQLCKHDGKFREGRTHCAHCGAGKAKALGLAPLGKGGRSEHKVGKDRAKQTNKHRGKDEKGQVGHAKPGSAAADAATVAAVYKELTALRAECAELRKKQGPAAKKDEPPAASAGGAVAEDEVTKEKKRRMDVLRGQIEHLEKGGDGLEDALKARREELEKLRLEIRSAHPLDVQLRNLDSKLNGVKKQREKLEDEANSVAKLILELKISLDKAAKAAAEKKLEEDQLAKERVELVAKHNATKLAEAEAAAGGAAAADRLPEQLQGLEDLDPVLKAGLQAYFAKKAAATQRQQPPPTMENGGSQPPDDPATAVAAATAAAAQLTRADRGQGGDGDDNMGGETEEAAKRRRLAGAA
jgi:hypothetical protein